MARRLDLHQELIDLLGSTNVYFQPPESVKLEYPCIVYELSGLDIKRANDQIYLHKRKYSITYVHWDPDSEFYLDILKHFELASFDRRFKADNLIHDVLTIYY